MRLEKKTALLLLRRKKTLSIAESCTGGLMAHTLTNVAGSSAFFLLGVVAYDNAAKTKTLKIPASLLAQYGAVSLEVAGKMAQGVRRILNTDIGMGITGIAGPAGGNKAKPVGLVFIAVSHGATLKVFEFHFKGNRSSNKRSAVAAALRILNAELA